MSRHSVPATSPRQTAPRKTPENLLHSQQDLPLSPIQHWFFERIQLMPQHWNQSRLFALEQSLNYAVLERAIGYLMRHHEGLRLSFQRTAQGWRQCIQPVRNDPPLDWYELSGSRGKPLHQAIIHLANRLNGQLNLHRDPLIRFVLIRTVPEEAERLLVIAHQLVIDSHSWDVLLTDLANTYRQLNDGLPVDLPHRALTHRQWLSAQQRHAASPKVLKERDYWQQLLRQAPVQLPVDCPPDLQNNSQQACRQLRLYLDAGATRALVGLARRKVKTTGASGRYQALTQLLLPLLAQPLLQWTGQASLLIDTRLSHRHSARQTHCLAHTLGWFEYVCPVLLSSDTTKTAATPASSVTPAVSPRAMMPADAQSYGLLRELAPYGVAAPLRQAPLAQFCFTNEDELTQRTGIPAPFFLESTQCGQSRSPLGLRPYLLELHIKIVEGRLQADWFYCRDFHQHVTIERLAVAFWAAIQHRLGRPPPTPPPPGDLPLTDTQPLSKLLKDIDDDTLFE